MEIILASNSPRRKELLEKAGFQFKVVPADIDESFSGIEPEELPEHLAIKKAETISAKHPNALVIGADTIVEVDGQVLGKPEDKQSAYEMLSSLSDKTHRVISAYAILNQSKDIRISKTFITEIEFFKLSESDINKYIETDEPFDKAGAYAIQGRAGKFVKNRNGSFSNVVGLNIEELTLDLKKLGLVNEPQSSN